MDVFFYEAFEEEAAALRRYLPADIDAGFDARTVQETGHDAPPAKLISIRTQSRIPAAWSHTLGGILSRSTGYDHLRDYAAHAERPIALGYLPLYCHRACAETAIMLTLALLRKLPRQMRQFHHFEREGLTGREAMGRNMLVVGVGHIGREVYRIAEAIGMTCRGVDLDPRHSDVQYTTIDAGLAEADAVVCAMDLTPINRGYFNAERLAKLKPGAIFVNVSRGELSPSTALLTALQSGRLAGVALDVYDHEPALAIALRTGGGDAPEAEVAAAIELAARPDVICTPHNAFNTTEAVERKSDHSVQQVHRFLADGRFLWPIPPAAQP